MEVPVAIERVAEAMDEEDGAELASRGASGLALCTADCTARRKIFASPSTTSGSCFRNQRTRLGIDHPLPVWHAWQDRVDEVGGRLHHAARAARWAQVAGLRQGEERLEVHADSAVHDCRGGMAGAVDGGAGGGVGREGHERLPSPGASGGG